MSRKSIMVVAILASLFGVVMLIRCRSGASPSSDRRVTGREGVAPRKQIPAPGNTPLPGPTRKEAPGAPEVDRSDEQAIEGTAIVVDPRGGEFRSESGSFVVVMKDPQSGRSEGWISVVVDEGRWTTRVKPGRSLHVSQLELGGSYVVLEPDEFRNPGDGKLSLRGRWPAPTVLRVLDEETFADLSEVTIAMDHVHGANTPATLSDKEILLDDGVSPIELRPVARENWMGWEQVLWVKAPGYAWSRIDVDFASPAPRQVILRPEATLEVTLHDPDTAWESTVGPELWIRLRMPFDWGDDFDEEEPWDEMRFVSPSQFIHWDAHAESIGEVEVPTTFRHLGAGRYAVTVELGRRNRFPVMLAHELVTLESGDRKSVSLGIGDFPTEPRVESETVRVAGTLFLSPAWYDIVPELKNGHDLRLRLEPVDRQTMRDKPYHPSIRADPGIPGLHSWEVDLPPGRYSFTIRNLSYTVEIDTGPHGRGDLEIRIPDPVCEVSLRIVDAMHEEPLPVKSINWSWRESEERMHGLLVGSEYDAATKSFRLRLPPGSVEFLAWGEGRSLVDSRVAHRLEPGWNEIVLRVRPPTGVVLYLTGGEARIPWPESGIWSLEMEPIDGTTPGNTEIWTSGGNLGRDGYHVKVESGGRYKVVVPKLDEFEPVEPFEIDIPSGEMVEHEIRVMPRIR